MSNEELLKELQNRIESKEIHVMFGDRDWLASIETTKNEVIIFFDTN